jgi:HSP20 family molecular chaperone IbpA
MNNTNEQHDRHLYSTDILNTPPNALDILATRNDIAASQTDDDSGANHASNGMMYRNTHAHLHAIPIHVDVVKRSDRYVILGDTPGVSHANISVSVDHDRVLSIDCMRESSLSLTSFNDNNNDSSAEGNNNDFDDQRRHFPSLHPINNGARTPLLLRSERLHGMFSRKIVLSADADISRITANISNGVLQIQVPRFLSSPSSPPPSSVLFEGMRVNIPVLDGCSQIGGRGSSTPTNQL